MINPTNSQNKIKFLLRGLSLLAPLILCIVVVVAVPAPQEVSDSERGMVTKALLEARRKNRSSMKDPLRRPSEIEDGLLGFTIWRWREAKDSDNPNLVYRGVRTMGGSTRNASSQKSDQIPERANLKEPLRHGDRLAFDIEAPRRYPFYLYVVSRARYTDESLKPPEPRLLFPTTNIPAKHHKIHGGNIRRIPSPYDDPANFELSLNRKDQISEELIIILSPKPLNLSPGALARQLDQTEIADLARWEKQWSAPFKQYDSPNTVGQVITLPEKEAAEGKRDLDPGDPAPQSIIYSKQFNPKAGKVNFFIVSLPVKQ
jgi:hypothetical protein